MALVIVDIARGEPRVAPKWVWVGITVFLFPIGPVLYLLWGRRRRHVREVQP
ncbi:PLD nuclease N-terminal domain-containing protein [Demequina sp. B12]|uniref:PLD nuclease N-terminal domain-containing protein n=1 Tax=Demequina sp. B12 TaxID=2992757 RepID=UPI0034E06547